MYLDSFRHLIEIEALRRENHSTIEAISSENKRISALNDHREKVKNEINLLSEQNKELQINELQNKIEETQRKVARLEEQLTSIKTLREQEALEDQIKAATELINSSEEIYFEKLELFEQNENQISTHHAFLQGSEKTLLDISLEVKEASEKLQAQIENREKRIESLLSLCAPNLVKIYIETFNRMKIKGHVSFLINKNCSACHMQVDSVLKGSLEEGRSFENCPHCGRFMLPETARY